MQQINKRSHDDFHGLSPEQIHRMLYFPFDTPEFFNFPEILRTEPEAPILTLIQWIANATDEKGLKATAKGNLPQKLCKQAFVDYRKHLPKNGLYYRTKINGKNEFSDLGKRLNREILVPPFDSYHRRIIFIRGIGDTVHCIARYYQKKHLMMTKQSR